ncbi:MAG: amino acid permease [Planctomycetota bacterium]|nr:amino acid permease [Planctomycetota bacterium]
MATLSKHVRFRSAAALVVANIIGAGIFTTTGFQASALGHPGWILALWVVGGVLALCGALCYAELGAAMPEAGGEYVYLRKTYGPAFGFMSMIVSLTAGFSAAIASASKAFVLYLGQLVPSVAENPRLLGNIGLHDVIACGVVWALIAIHGMSARRGVWFNDLVTLFKVIGIVAIIIAGIVVASMMGRGDVGNLTHVADTYHALSLMEKLSAFATSLVFVMFCYSGWNASAYIASEMKDPQRDLPRSLLIGTGLVVVLYLGLNVVYLLGAPVEQLAGQAEVGLISGRALFGQSGASMVSVVLCVSILASASAMTIAGPRVYFAFGSDVKFFDWLAKADKRSGAPKAALVLQGFVTTIIILSGGIAAIQQYAGFTLSLFAALAVSCVIVLRYKSPDLKRPFKAWGYPVTPLLFLILSAWMMVFALLGERWFQAVLGLATVGISGLAFLIVRKLSRRSS